MISKFNTILIKKAMAFSTELEKVILKYAWKYKNPKQTKKHLEKEQRWRHPDFKLYYKATVIKTVWYQHKNRHIEQLNRREGPEINPSLYSKLI